MKAELAVAEAMEATEPYLDPKWQTALPRLDLAELSKTTPPDRAWALDGFIPLLQATYLTGPGSAGKSLLGQQLATAAVLGRPFMGIDTARAPAIYITCEDDEHELHRRQMAICSALSVPMAALAGKLHLVSLAGHVGNELATFAEKVERDEFGNTSALVEPTSLYRIIEGTAVALGAGLTILDNVAHFFAGNENIRNQVAAFMALMNRLAIRTSGSVLLIGHPNKAGASFSGSTAWENQVRSRLYMEAPEIDADPDMRVLRREKANYAANGGEIRFRWHAGAFVRDEDLPPNVAEEMAANAMANHDNEAFLNCLRERNRQLRAVSAQTCPNYAITQFLNMPEAKGINKKRLKAAMDRLYRTGAIETGFLWRDTAKGRDVLGLREVPQTLPQTGPK